ncbi:MAG: endolytic transglycosylase MltG [Candidatus Roizmanbacteria bacterium]
MKKILFIIVFLITIVGSAYIVYREGVLPVNSVDTAPLTFIVHKGDTINTIINNLAMDRLIRNRIVMYGIIRKLGIERDIQAGSFKLTRSMDAYEVAQALTKATDDVWVTVREGLRKEEIADVFAKDLPTFVPSEFISKADEGYLFPDTYLVPRSADADFMISLMTDTYKSKVNQSLRDKMKTNNLTEKDVIILASLVEREAISTVDRQPIASILLRRLQEPMRLQVDATVQYSLGYQRIQKSWWKRPLLLDDLKVESPYNTYTNDGLPKGPICNPGLAAIEAVINADSSTQNLFYVHDAKGNVYFAKTYNEHLLNVEKYVDAK